MRKCQILIKEKNLINYVKKIFFTEFNFLKINMKKRIKSKKIVKDSC
jgi:hypothetical protein